MIPADAFQLVFLDGREEKSFCPFKCVSNWENVCSEGVSIQSPRLSAFTHSFPCLVVSERGERRGGRRGEGDQKKKKEAAKKEKCWVPAMR
jgi:hypothetical protein